MPLPADPSPALGAYADPERLVTADWLSANPCRPGLVIVESDEDVLLYDTGHIPGAVKIDWHTDLNDPHVRDYIDGAQFAELMKRKGIARDDTVVIYGDKSNWWAAYALWVFTLFGHPDVRLLDGGRDLWISDGRDTTLDVPESRPPGTPSSSAMTHRSVPSSRTCWTSSATSHSSMSARRRSTPANAPTCRTTRKRAPCAAATFPPPDRSRGPRRPTTTDGSAAGANSKSCTGSCSPTTRPSSTAASASAPSHTWFVLTHLLGLPRVRNYDGSWTEWGNAVRVPVAVGEEPGSPP